MKRMLSILVVLCMSVSLLSGVTLPASAATSGSCGENLTWKLADGTLTISGVGKMEDYYSGAPWHSLRSSIKTVVIENGVTSIGDSAFYDCKALTAFTVAEDNQEYSSRDGDLYNKEQTELIQYATGKTETAFAIPEGVTSIEKAAFSNCTSLSSVTIPNSVTNIGDYAFLYCESLISVTIPDSVTSIGISAFSYCYSLSSVTIPNSVTNIGDYAFFYCESLISVTIPDSVTSIGTSAFSNCASLNSVTIPSGVTSIGYGAFGYCCALKWVAIPVSLTRIEGYAFFDCSNLTDVYYKGDKADRGKIAISSGNDYFEDATWHYNAEPVTELLGDINHDENVDVYDAVMLFQYSMLPDLYQIAYTGSVDFNGDGAVDVYDAVLLFQHSMLPDLYPIG